MPKQEDAGKPRLQKLYDFMLSPRGTEMTGYGSELCLKPVPVDPETGGRALKQVGKQKGQPKSFSKKEFDSGKISIQWLWPGHRIGTLLQLLKLGLLTGRAALAVSALKRVTAGRRPSTSCADWEGWANDIVKQEAAAEKAFRKNAREKKKSIPEGGKRRAFRKE